MSSLADLTLDELATRRLALRDQQKAYSPDVVHTCFDAWLAITDDIIEITQEIVRRVTEPGDLDAERL